MSATTMQRSTHAVFLSLLLALLCGLLPAARADIPAVPTQNNDNARTGANLSETILTPANVNVAHFGKIFTRTLDANVNGQVLYVPNLTIQGSIHNVIYAYTSNNSNNSPCSLYAFDADDPTASTYLWRHQFTNSAQWTTCTPVIDTAGGIIYVLTKDNNDSGATRLRALDLLTGNEKTGSPVTIAATVPGTGDGSSGGMVSFNTAQANCRPGLLLLNGVVYFAFAHNSDSFPYQGWVFGYQYNGTKFTQTAVFNTCPNGGDAGVWQAGKGLTADNAGNIYFSTGNGTFTANSGGNGYGMCYMKLSTPNLNVVDWFAPHDEQSLSNQDLDLGNSGLVGIPGTTRLFGGATKFGSAFLLDSTNMGGFTPGGPDKVVQRLDGVSNNDNVGQNPIAWDAGTTKYVYLWPNGYNVQQFKYDTGLNKLNPAGVWKQAVLTSGGSLAVSANGSSNGILWAAGNDGVLHAFDAGDVSKAELWNSAQNNARDQLGAVGHFQFPTVVNGKVYVPTNARTIVAYSLQSAPTATATFVRTDTSTAGSWHGVYGKDGYNIINNAASYPAYAAVTPGGQSSYTWAASTIDTRALQQSGGTNRIAACWYSSTNFTVDVNLTDGSPHQMSFYCLDWDGQPRTQKVEMLDASTGAVLDTQNVSSFGGGVYLVYTLTGHVKVRFTNAADINKNAVLSGLFFDPPGTSNPPTSNTAKFLRLDGSTSGSWKGVYGSAGYTIPNYGTSFPTYVSIGATGYSLYTWEASTSDTRALQKTSGSDRIASCLYAYTNFTVDVNLTDGSPHQMSFYCLDWDGQIRTQKVEMLDASTGAVLDTQNVSSFGGGVYLVYTLTGHVKVRFTNTADTNRNAVLSGLFLD